MYRIFFLLLLLCPILLYSQSETPDPRIKQVDSLSFAAVLDLRKGQFDEALLDIKAAKELASAFLDRSDEKYRICLFLEGRIYGETEQFEKAIAVHRRLMSILVQLPEPDSLQLGQNFDNFGTIYFRQGDFRQAEQCFRSAAKIWDALEGENPTLAGINHNNMGMLFQSYGQLDRAHEQFEISTRILSPALPPRHPFLVQLLSNLGTVAYLQGEYARAAEYYEEAYDLIDSTQGPKNPVWILIGNNLAGVYQKLNKLDEATSLANLVHERMVSSFGQEHPKVGMSLVNLAKLADRSGQLDTALLLAHKGIRIMEESLGESHHDFGPAIQYLGNLYWKTGQHEKALRQYIRANSLAKSYLTTASQYLSESELESYSAANRSGVGFLLSAAEMHPTNEPNAAAVAYDHMLFTKGFLLTAAKRIRQYARRDPFIQQSYVAWQEYLSRIAGEMAKPIESRADISIWQDSALLLEKQLVQSASAFSRDYQQVGWEQVQAGLGPDEMAIEFVRYPFLDPESTDRIRYAAILLSHDHDPRLIPLADEAVFQKLLVASGNGSIEAVDHLYGYNQRGFRVQQDSLQTLFELVWAPLLEQIPPGVTIYHSPDGLLNRLNLGAVPFTLDSVILDRNPVIQLTSTRDLVSMDNRKSKAPESAWVFGAIRYDTEAPEDATLQENGALASRSSDAVLSLDADWPYLPGTEREVKAIADLMTEKGLDFKIWTGSAATEDRFLHISDDEFSPDLIHLATHGFFFKDQASGTAGPGAGMSMTENPMFRSGLVMAGANHEEMTTLEEGEDGILTAYEISELDLSHTETVVLSACETGLGEVLVGEGVYGLQRAFKIAGVQNLIISLWQVSDRNTKLFMETFYGIWLRDGKDISDAFRQAQLEMRDRFLSPYQWAGFVLVQ